jgi:UDP-N-acetylmuramoylalanine--D-glutamate ligase
MGLDVRGKTILVAGLARSGCAVAALLRRHGARVLGVDDDATERVQERWAEHGLGEQAAAAFDAVFTDGDWGAVPLDEIAAVALSPGVPREHPRIVELARQVPVYGEIEWGARACAAPMIAITGTNGKSTTTELVGHLLRSAGFRAEALGNVGRPFCDCADRLSSDAVAVIEVSSFQLESVEEFRPAVGVVLNLAPDHLDRYPDLAAYYAAKQRLAAAVPAAGTFVTWTGCREARGWDTDGARLLFGEEAAGAEVILDDEAISIGRGPDKRTLLPLGELALKSPPNLLNAAAAVAAALPLTDDYAALAEGLRSFVGLSHRHELVARHGEVKFVNDSKATNVHAVCGGLRGYSGEVVLIAGGRGKGEDYGPLRDVMAAVKAVVLIGEETDALAAVLDGVVPLHRAEDLEAAVSLANELAQPDRTVLLSPACASFDMFRDYRHRGETFAAAARALGAAGEEVS